MCAGCVQTGSRIEVIEGKPTVIRTFVVAHPQPPPPERYDTYGLFKREPAVPEYLPLERFSRGPWQSARKPDLDYYDRRMK